METPMLLEPLARELVGHGVLGAILVAMIFAYRAKDAELTAERKARIEDAKGYTEASLELQNKVLDAVDKSDRVLEAIQQAKRYPR